jgi:hypothetical protein
MKKKGPLNEIKVLEKVYLHQIKKKAKAEGKTCHAKTMLSLDKASMKNTPHVPLRQITEE